MEESQKVWDVIEPQIERSKIKRYNWKKIIGTSLTKKASELYAKGLTNNEAIDNIKKDLIAKGYSPIKDFNLFKNLKIGICARYGEISSESKEIDRWKAKYKNIECPHCEKVFTIFE